MSDTIVRFAEVSKSYDGQSLVVDNLNLDVHRGELLTLLGSSGSGKTSSLMMVAGFESPTSGDILLNGNSITRLPAYKRNIGVVFQNYALFPHMTVEQNLAFPLEARRTPRAEMGKKITQVLDVVRLAGYAARRINQLSGGQQQRVAIARALIFGPSLVLMDEPLGALDRQLRVAMQYEIKHIHETLGITIIYVTHDQEEALTMSNRVAVLEKGRIEQIAAPSDLYERPMTSFVAKFVGENNCLPGHVESSDGSLCCVATSWGIVRAVAANVGPVGSRTIWSIRPERVGLNPRRETVDNIFEAVVLELIYLGDQIRVRLAIGDHDNFIVKLSNSHDLGRLAVGEKVKVGWRAHDCRALNADG